MLITEVQGVKLPKREKRKKKRRKGRDVLVKKIE
jgi:hypothetical protein